MEIRPLTPTEQKYTYAQSMQIEGQTGTIGHLRGDFATTGYGFYTTWFDTRPQWKTDEFKADLDTVINALREDERIFQWLKQLTEKIREDDWREFEKALHLYLKDKDTSVFDTEELFAIYDSIMLMSIRWREQFKLFAKEHPKSAKIKSKGTWVKKYYALCFKKKKELHSQVVTDAICTSAFSELM